MIIFSKKKNQRIIRKITAFALIQLMAFNSVVFAVKDRKDLQPEELARGARAPASSSAAASNAPMTVVYTEDLPTFFDVSIPSDVVEDYFFRLKDLKEERPSEGARTVGIRSPEFQEALSFTRMSSWFRRSFFRYLNEAEIILVINMDDSRPRAINRVIEQAIYFAEWGAHVRVDVNVNPSEDVVRLLRYRPTERKARLEEVQEGGSFNVREWTYRGSLEVNFDFRGDEGAQFFTTLAPLLATPSEEERRGEIAEGASLGFHNMQFGEEGIRSLEEILRSGTVGVLRAQYLHLGPTGVTRLAQGLRENTSLQRLSLVGTRLGDEVTTLVQVLTSHPSLIDLFISSRGSPIGIDALRALLRENSTLRVLNLGGNGDDRGGFGDEETIALIEGLMENPESDLQELYLNANYIGVRGARALGNLLQRNSRVKNLVLCGNPFREDGGVALAEGLRENRTLEYLDLHATQMEHRGVHAILEALEPQQALRKLRIGSNPIQPLIRERDPRFGYDREAVERIGHVLESFLRHNTVLRELDFAFNLMGERVLFGLVRAMHTNRTLRNLKLAGNEITDAGMEALGQALGIEGVVLEELDLTYNGITALGAARLAEGMRRNQSVIELRLDSNTIEDEGVVALARAFEGRHKRLKVLSLRKNKIGDRGATSLAYLSMRNPRLREVYLDENDIRIFGGQAIGYALSADAAGLGGLLRFYNDHELPEDGVRRLLPMARLQRLSLTHNKMIGEGNAFIARGMQVNPSLQDLQLYNTGIRREDVAIFVEALRRNRSLQYLNLGGNNLSDASALELGAGLMRNRSLRRLDLYTNSITEATAGALGRAHVERIFL